MPDGDSLETRYQSVVDQLADAASRAGRRADDIILLAATTNASIDQIRQLIALGHVDFAESRAQTLAHHAAQVDEYLQRHRELPSARRAALPRRVRWHMIGRLQRNRVRKLIRLVRLIHSVDSLRLAEEIHAATAAARTDDPAEVLLQVNLTGEKQRPGIAPAAARHLIEQIDTMFSVRVRGLMAVTPPSAGPESARPVFQRCRELFDDIRRAGNCTDRFDILSMGTSDDFDIAVECGANLVRVGKAIFGPSKPEDNGPC